MLGATWGEGLGPSDHSLPLTWSTFSSYLPEHSLAWLFSSPSDHSLSVSMLVSLSTLDPGPKTPLSSDHTLAPGDLVQFGL